METDRPYILVFTLVILGIPAVAAFPSIDITGMFAESFSGLQQSGQPSITREQEEFVNRMYGGDISVSSAESRVEIEKKDGKTYAYPKGVNVSKFDEKIFDTSLMREELYTDMDGFNLLIKLDRPIKSGSKSELPEEIRRMEKQGLLEINNVLKSSNSVSLKISSNPGQAFQRLNGLGKVEKGFLDSKAKVLNLDANGVVGADSVRQTYSINGSGEVLAVLDTGVEASHVDFASRVIDQKDYSGDGTGDVEGHGTHVSGTVLGDGSAQGGYYPGMSQKASLMSVKVLGDDGSGFSSDIQAGIEYAADNNASVISLSLGEPNAEYSLTSYNSSVQYARNRGSVVVVAAGNDGGFETVNSPGSVPDAVTVGAVDDSESLTYFSSKGPENVYYNIKPEVTAPGSFINSTSNSYPSTNYTSKSGTSMATPVVSGIVGLVRDQNPGWAVEEVENAVIASGEGNQIGDGKNVFERGTGVINASKAVDPELKLSETRFNFGNISAKQKHSRVIGLENPTAQQKNYSISSEIHMYNRSSQTVESGQASITFNQSSVSIPAGGSRDVEMYLEINQEYSEPYGGLARFEADESYAILVGGYTNNASQLSSDVSLNASTIDINDSVRADGSGSVNPGGTIQSYSWDMGDGTSLNGPVVEHSYSSLGDYTVNLTVEDSETNQDSKAAPLSVKDLQNPQASFTANDTSPEASIDTVYFNSSQSSDNLEISHYLWDLDGDGSYDKNASAAGVEKSYSTVGTRTVELKVVDTSGNSAVTAKDIDVQDTTSPDISLGLNSTNLTIGEEVQMDGSSSTDNTGITSYSWSYSSSTASVPAFVESFDSPGIYTVELNVSDAYGNQNSTTKQLKVSDITDPQASLDVETKVSVLGEQVNFSAVQSSDNVAITDYRWDVNNDSSFEASAVNFSKTMSSPGNYSIGLEVEDSSNNTDFKSTWFYVNDTQAPQIELGIESDFPETGEKVTLNASNTTDNDFVKKYDWDLSTASTEDGPATINHTYNSEGSYTIQLNVTDNSSNTDLEQRRINVKDFVIDIEEPEGDTTGESQRINLSFTRNVSELNTTLNSSGITLNQENNTFYSGNIGLNESDYNLYVDANDSYGHSQNKTLKFTNSILPQINSYSLSEKLAGLNNSMVFTADISEDHYRDVTVEIERPNGSSTTLELQNQSVQTSERVLWNRSFTPNSQGNYSALLNVTDTFGEEKTLSKIFEVAEVVDFNLTLKSGQRPEFALTDYSGENRIEANAEKINSSIPKDNDWEILFEDNNTDSRLRIKGLNITEDISSNYSFKPSFKASPGIERFQESTAFAADIALNYSSAEIRINHSGDVEDAYRCADWSFASESCGSGWTDVSSDLTTLNSTHAVLEISEFSAYSFGYTEEDDGGDSGGSGGSSGSSGGSSGGFGYNTDPEIVVEESKDRIFIYNIYEGHSIEFNETGLPITGLEFESDADNGTLEIQSEVMDTDLSFTSVFRASSNISGPYTLQFEVGSEWLEENSFEASEVSLYSRENDRWVDQQASVLDELPERSIYEVEVQEFSTFGIGVDRACYSSENVTAETDSSCRTYSSPCQVPEDAERVESCQSFEQEEQVKQEIEQKKQEVDDEAKIAKLSQAETLVEQGDVSQARDIVRSISTDTGEETGPSSNVIIAVIASILLVAGGLTSYVFISRRRTHRMVVEMGELIDMLKELDRRGIDVKVPAMKLQKANTALKNGDYNRAVELTSEVKEYLQRDPERRNWR